MNDPMSRQLSEQLMAQKMAMARVNNLVKTGAKFSSLKRYESEMSTVQQQYDQMGQDLREKIRDRKRVETEHEIKRADTEASVLAEEEREFQKLVDQQKKEAEAIGGKSIDIEMMRGELKNLDTVFTNIAEEREKLRVELHADSRINVRQWAEKPELEYHAGLRWAILGIAGLGGFFLPMIGIVFWDVRSQRINAVSEISRGLGVPVLGSVPAIPAQVLRRLGARQSEARPGGCD